MGSSGRRILHQVPVPIILCALHIRTSVSQQFSSAFAHSSFLTVPIVGSFGTKAKHWQFSQAAFAHIRSQQLSTAFAHILFLCMSDSSGPFCPEDTPPDTNEISAAFALIPFLCMPTFPLGAYGTNTRHQLTVIFSGIHAWKLSHNSSSNLVSFPNIFFFKMPGGLVGPRTTPQCPAVFNGLYFTLFCCRRSG